MPYRRGTRQAAPPEVVRSPSRCLALGVLGRLLDDLTLADQADRARAFLTSPDLLLWTRLAGVDVDDLLLEAEKRQAAARRPG